MPGEENGVIEVLLKSSLVAYPDGVLNLAEPEWEGHEDLIDLVELLLLVNFKLFLGVGE